MLSVQTRDKARLVSKTLNVIANKKRFKQTPIKGSDGWNMERVGGILKLPMAFPPRNNPLTYYVRGIKVIHNNISRKIH